MQTTATYSTDHSPIGGQRRYYRVERKFSTKRPPKEFVCALLRAHCGE